LDPGLRNYFENEVDLTNEQIELVQGHAQRIALGLGRSKHERGESDRHIAGIRRTIRQIEQTLGRMTRVLHKGQSKAERLDLDTGIKGHLNRLGISDGHIAEIQKILQDHKFTDKQIEQTLGAMTRIVYIAQSEGLDFELDPKMRGYLENEVGLTNDQIGLVRGIAQRVAHGQRDQSSNAREDKRRAEHEAGESKLPASKR
jgi:hypothetical protein